MSHKTSRNLNERLKVGQQVCVSTSLKPEDEWTATITEVSPDKIRLKFPSLDSQLSLRKGAEIRIQYTEEGILYCWEGKVVTVSTSKNQCVISIEDVGVTVQRRQFARFRVSIPFTFTVFEAAETEIVGAKVNKSKTENIGLSGLLFETNLPLNVGDQLALNLSLTPSTRVNAFGWVVRSERAERKGKPFNLVALRFLQLEEEKQRQLSQFLLESQSE
ncbi:PilZ domain-containing protein [Acidobacteria bacterium AH-259-D05]|nr:PilZ domain-containing protein [Acidobacteria bacterium AH-259-D05]